MASWAEDKAVRVVSVEQKVTLAFARQLELALSVAGFCTDKNTVYAPELTSGVWAMAEFTVSVEEGTFRVMVEREGEEMSR